MHGGILAFFTHIEDYWHITLVDAFLDVPGENFLHCMLQISDKFRKRLHAVALLGVVLIVAAAGCAQPVLNCNNRCFDT